MVLATDMSCHFQQIKAMKSLLQQPEGWVGHFSSKYLFFGSGSDPRHQTHIYLKIMSLCFFADADQMELWAHLFCSWVIMFSVDFHLFETSWITASGSCPLVLIAVLFLQDCSQNHNSRIAVVIDLCKLCAMHDVFVLQDCCHHILCTVSAGCCVLPCNVPFLCTFAQILGTCFWIVLFFCMFT